MRTALLALVTTSIASAAAVAPASAQLPSDPLAKLEQPLRIMHVGRALDKLARPLRPTLVLDSDTGIDLEHQDLRRRLYRLPHTVAAPNQDHMFGNHPPTIRAGSYGWDMIGNANGCAPGPYAPDANPDDPLGCSGHGTTLAGILGAAWNNGKGGAGIAPNARLLALRTCWDDDQCYGDVEAEAMRWATARGARVITFSWLASPGNTALKHQIDANPQTLFVTIPSGNGGAYNADSSNPYPCDLAKTRSNVICVSVSSRSNGLSCAAYGRHVVDLAVPTANSVTTSNGGGYIQPTGCATSWASPTLGGLAAILFGEDPKASAAQVKRALIAGARPASAWKGRSVSGGIGDALGAVKAFDRIRGLKPPRCLGRRATIIGPLGADEITGTPGPDVIVGLGGNDVIHGGRGADLICSGAGNDRLLGGSGRDRISGGPGIDFTKP